MHITYLDKVQYVLPNRFPLGLDALIIGRNIHPAWVILLYCINPFTVWYFTVLSMGLTITAGIEKLKARFLSFLIWFIIVGFVIGVVLITGGTRIGFRFGA